MRAGFTDPLLLGGVLLVLSLVLGVELWKRSRGGTGKPGWAPVWTLGAAAVAYGSLPEAGAGALPFALLVAALALGLALLHRRRRPPRTGPEVSPLEDEDRLLAGRILALRATPVAQIMTPADRMTYALASSSIEKVVGLVRQTGHSRIPLLDEPGGRPLGFLHAKDLGPFLHGPSTPDSARDLMREVLRVPPKEQASRLLDSFRHKRIHLAVVTDPLGRALGVVSLGDFYAHLLGQRDVS